jgi:uncharacterized protein YndB with AHSA1/START domain
MKWSITTSIAAPPGKVFALLTDEEQMKQWIAGLVSTRYKGDVNRQDPVGAKFVQRSKEGGRIQQYEGEVIAFKKNEHYAMRLGNHAFSMEVHYRLKPQDGGTGLEYTGEATYNGWFYRMLGKVFWGFMKKMSESQVAKLKQVAEE